MKLIIDRNTWLRGEGSEVSRLLRREDSKMCCLGFLAISCNVPEEAIMQDQTPSNVCFEHRLMMPEFLFDADSSYRTVVSGACIRLMGINDNEDWQDAEREEKLIEIFAENGIQLEFIN